MNLVVLLVLVLTQACSDTAVDSAPDSEVGGQSIRHERTENSEEVAVEMQGFSWLVEGELAAMPLPGRQRALIEDVSFLEEVGIQRLVSLTEEPPTAAVFEAAGIGQEHLPVKDFTPPTLEQMVVFVDLVTKSVEQGEPVGVHCTAGLGRSGTMAATYFVANGLSAEQAINTVRQLRPGSIETEAQEAAVHLYEEHMAIRE